jgi:DNA modification methylase
VTNKLFYGDNLDVLRRKIESGSVDLCYIDPPFNSKRIYSRPTAGASTCRWRVQMRSKPPKHSETPTNRHRCCE